jgi:hypothetical protein
MPGTSPLRLPCLLIQVVSPSQIGVEFLRGARDHGATGSVNMPTGAVLEQHDGKLRHWNNLRKPCPVERVVGGINLELAPAAQANELRVAIEPLKQLLALRIVPDE